MRTEEERRLRGIIARNKAAFEALQKVCDDQRAEIKALKTKIGLNDVMGKVKDSIGRSQERRKPAGFDELLKALKEGKR